MKRFLAAFLTACIAGAACAQGYPSKPIRFIVAVPPGGGADFVARALGEKLAEGLHQPVVVENRPGAGDSVGALAVARAEPDGHTMLLATNNLTVSAALERNLPFDLEHDFAPVGRLVIAPLGLYLHPSVGAKSVRELVALARAQPGKLNCGVVAGGSIHFLTLQWFRNLTRTDITAVPYKGAGPVVNALVAGEVQMGFAGLTGAAPQVSAGRLRALAVITRKRSQLDPDLPSIAEAGYPLDVQTFFGVLVPRGTPATAIERLHKEIGVVLEVTDMKARLFAAGVEAAPLPPQEFGRLIRDEIRQWKAVMQATAKP